ncbi:MAG: Rrf2 family transcriptional regulator [Bacilli bacterium]|nr:Rrf2 family transcriptional regulator [Bacilli bacterium]
MKISTKGRYALAIMINLASNYDSGRYVSLKEISLKENISLKYLEKIMINLNKENIIDVARGNNGGYKLKKDPSKYIIGDILRIAEGDLMPVSCINTDCEKKNECKTFPLWKELNDLINNYLDSKTLADYIERSSL